MRMQMEVMQHEAISRGDLDLVQVIFGDRETKAALKVTMPASDAHKYPVLSKWSVTIGQADANG